MTAQNKVVEILRTKTANIAIKFKAKLVARELEDEDLIRLIEDMDHIRLCLKFTEDT